MEALVANGHKGAPRHDRRGVTEIRADSTSGADADALLYGDVSGPGTDAVVACEDAV